MQSSPEVLTPYVLGHLFRSGLGSPLHTSCLKELQSTYTLRGIVAAYGQCTNHIVEFAFWNFVQEIIFV